MAKINVQQVIVFMILLVSTLSVSAKWDHFVFAQQWPPSVCAVTDLGHTCQIPKTVTTWTVHGIWPSLGNTGTPNCCNKTAVFDPDSINGIRDQLTEFWPNLYTDTPIDDFWKHEWCKHGTCAVTLPALNSELNYFSKGIVLAQQYDLLSVLKKAGFTPDDQRTFSYFEIFDALKNGLGQSPLPLSCMYDKATSTQYLAQVEFCLDQQFAVIECPKSYAGYDNNNVMSNVNDDCAYCQHHKGRFDMQSSWQRDNNVISIVQNGGVGGSSNPEPCRDTEPVAYPTRQS